MPNPANQSLLWTALPNGLTEDGGLRVSVMLVPRLDPGDDQPYLSSFPEWLDWPATLEQATFHVTYGAADGFGPGGPSGRRRSHGLQLAGSCRLVGLDRPVRRGARGPRRSLSGTHLAGRPLLRDDRDGRPGRRSLRNARGKRRRRSAHHHEPARPGARGAAGRGDAEHRSCVHGQGRDPQHETAVRGVPAEQAERVRGGGRHAGTRRALPHAAIQAGGGQQTRSHDDASTRPTAPTSRPRCPSPTRSPASSISTRSSAR